MIDGDRVVVVAGEHAGRTGVIDNFEAQRVAIKKIKVLTAATRQQLLASLSVREGHARVRLDAESGQPSRDGMPGQGGRGGCHAIIPMAWLVDVRMHEPPTFG